MKLCNFLYNFMFINQITGKISHDGFFQVIGMAVMTWAFIHAVLHGSNASYDLWLVFGTVVVGNGALQKVIQARSGVKQIDPSDKAN